MGLRNKVASAVDKAFEKIADLLVDVEFTNKNTTGFDFNNSRVTGSTDTFETKGFPFSKIVKVDNKHVSREYLLLKTGGVNFNGYTKVKVAGEEYKCVTSESDEYVTTLLIERIT